MPATNAQRLVAALVEAGVRFVYTVPGESYLPILDELDGSPIRTITTRHEGGAGYMALATGIVDDNIGALLVSRAPGALNTALPIQVAAEDERPLLAIIGDVQSTSRGHFALQEMDYGQVFGGFAKRIIHGTTEDLYLQVVQACALAKAGTPGPVVFVLPEDLQGIPPEPRPRLYEKPVTSVARSRESDAAKVVLDALGTSTRPLMLIGRGLETRRPEGIEALATDAGIPVCTECKAQDRFPNDHAYYVGELGYSRPQELVQMIGSADLIVAIGASLDSSTMGEWNGRPLEAPRIVQVTRDEEMALKRGIADVVVPADPAGVATALVEHRGGFEADASWSSGARDLAARLRELARGETGDAILPSVIRAASRALAGGGSVSADAGIAGGWLQRCFEFTGTQVLIENRCGAMGLGIPGAVAAKLARPALPALAFVGDGALLMTGFELATAMREQAPIVVILYNNDCYGTIARAGGGDGSAKATTLVNPDFATFAACFGMSYLRADAGGDHDDLVASALAAGGGAIVEIRERAPLPKTY